MAPRLHRLMVITALTLAVAIPATGAAGDTAPATQPATQPVTSPATQPTEPTKPDGPATLPDPETIERQLLEQLESNPVVHPTQNRPIEPIQLQTPPGAASAGVDPRVLGVAPGQERPTLRREGEFVVNRRGRMVRAPDGQHILFVFEADSDTAPEPPMTLSACRMLQNMEDIVRERGDKIVFIVSGQVLVYRGVNYLLPTMMRLAIDDGNLQN